jgi:phosphatidylglycerol:prolipoprotein diacylglycerol transferase
VYPTISDLLQDLFGINIPLPIQSFGFFVAISFLLAAYTLSLELKRKENQGLLKPTTRKVLVGAPATKQEILFNAIIGFLVGYKLLFFLANYSELVDNPQKALLSKDGSIIGGIILAAALAYWKFREKNNVKREKPEWVEETVAPHEMVGNITMIAAVSGLIGAKIFHNLEYPQELIDDPIGSLLSFSGLTMYGGLIVAFFATTRYGKKHGIPVLHLCDATAAGLMLAYGFGRIGCQVAGDGDWGIVNLHPQPSWLGFLPDWFWSYTYPHNVINEGIPIPGCIGKHCNMLAQPVFPTPLYESIVCIAFFFLLWSVRKKFNVPGRFFSLYILLNGIERFAIESIRVNSKYHVGGLAFTQAQLISLLLILGGVAGLVYFRKLKDYSEIHS